MNLIDRVILEWSYKTKKGYPDINNQEDMALFESLFGYDLTEPINEAPKLTFDQLSPDAKVIADKIMQLIDVKPEQIKGISANSFYIYVPSDDRPIFFDKLEDSELIEVTKSRI